MTDPGLTRRLRQQAHRSGLAVGLSMAVAIAVLIGGFTWLYVELDPWVRDFAGAEPAPTATSRASASSDRSNSDENEEDQPEEEPTEEDSPTETPEPEEDDNDIQPVDEDDSDFDADYQIIALEAVRLRSGPGVNFDIVIDGLPPGTPLEFMGEREPSQNPDADGDTEWLQFQTEDGQEGWIRQIDVGET
jgi:hypothetical protein